MFCDSIIVIGWRMANKRKRPEGAWVRGSTRGGEVKCATARPLETHPSIEGGRCDAALVPPRRGGTYMPVFRGVFSLTARFAPFTIDG